jgi:hypothetical protein
VLCRSGVIQDLPADPLLAFPSSRYTPISLGSCLHDASPHGLSHHLR